MPGNNHAVVVTTRFSILLVLLVLPLLYMARELSDNLLFISGHLLTFLRPFRIPRSVSILTLLALLISPIKVWADITLTMTADPDPVRP